LSTALREFMGNLPHLMAAFRLTWSAAKGWTSSWVVLLVVQGLLPVATVHLTRLVVDALAAAIGGGLSFDNFQPVLLYGGLMGGVFLLASVIQTVGEWIRTAQSELIQDHLSLLVQDKSAAVDLAFYELPDFHDHLYRARHDARDRPLALLQSSGSLLQNGVTLIAMAAVLMPYGIWLPPALVLSTLPAFYIVLKWNRRHHAWSKRTTPDRRRATYYDWVLTDSMFAPELRLFGLVDHFQSAFRTLRQRLRGERLDMLKKQFRARLAAEMLAMLVSGATLFWIVRQALLGAVTLGDIALFYQAFQRGQGVIRALLTNLGEIYNSSLFLGNLFEFLQLTPEVVDPARPVPVPAGLKEGVRFRDVTFRYPGASNPVLRDVNLTIPAGKIVAIVGENGAGKSTLIKLMCRFYDPQAGAVEWDGVDLRSVGLDALRRRIALMPQEPVHYQATARENITLGSLDTDPRLEDVRRAAHSAGADRVIDRLPEGYETLLGKWFVKGTELSAGEWQRLGMARAFLRKGDLIILDEPTSMMDSWSEADWFDRLRSLASGRAAVVITHRLTIARRADLIYVMMGGEVAEAGTHEALLRGNAHYARSWQSQMRSQEETPAPSG
jgi:ATP-binding cassette subfamily B protein